MKHNEVLIEKIAALKHQRGAVILAHNYQLPEVQDIADFTGDSLELSRKAAETDARVIVFCGVHFMAETAKILSPDKTVLIPDIHAGCPMADMINAEQLREFKKLHPGLPVVAYVNTSAEVKAESDICCTSANAVRVVESMDADEILFVPDKSLGAYVASKTSKKIIAYCGFCPTHHRILAQDVIKTKREHPDALIVAHPECTMDAIRLADAVESTSGMIRYVKASSAREFIMCTERGILHRLKKDNPDKVFYNPSPLNICPNMKKITLEKVLWSLEDMQYRVELPQEMIEKARAAIEGMIAI
ncbi:MAG: quinolinate synthase NadA [Armatimonadetes bacterium]|nr:quinolinate synthase NadA [Armatimonadota bacterium]